MYLALKRMQKLKEFLRTDRLKASSNVPFCGEAFKDLGKVLLGFSLLKYQRWHLLMGEDSVGITEEGVIEHRDDSRSTLE